MAEDSQARQESYTLHRAIDDVFGRPPLWPWSAIAVIVLGGVAGAAAAGAIATRDGTQTSALRGPACIGYGVVVGALITLLPLAGRLPGLWRSLGAGSEADGAAWWPRRLLAAALRGTPDLRRTQQDFAAAVDRAGPEARSILAHRLWPAWVSAFVAPVLGLLAAWEAGKQIEVVAGQGVADILMQFVPQVSPPMVATIAAALALMVALVALDQATKGLLQRWCTTVGLADGESDAVRALIGEQAPAPRLTPQVTAAVAPVAAPSSPSSRSAPVAAEPAEPLQPEDLDKLMEAFSRRGKGG